MKRIAPKTTVKICLLAAMLLLIPTIGSLAEQPPPPDSIVFTDTLLTESQKGFPTQTQTDHAWYLFPDGTEGERAQWVHGAETILAAAKNQYGLQPKTSQLPKVYFDAGSDQTQLNLHAASLSLGLADTSHRGALFFFMSGGKLPAWLCAGLELHHLDMAGQLEGGTDVDIQGWREEAGAKGLPGIGDEWMIPGLMEGALSDEAHMVALSFVRELMEADALAGLMALYMDGQSIWEAEQLKNALWNGFAGGDSEAFASGGKMIYQHLYNQTLRMRPYPPFHAVPRAFAIRTAHSRCLFGQDGWTYETANHYARISIDGIQYTKDWFGVVDEAPITVLYCVRGETFPGYPAKYLGSGIIFSPVLQTDFSPFGIVHESVHAFADRLNVTADCPHFPESLAVGTLFEEGLASTLEIFHCMETADEKYASDMAAYVYGLLDYFWEDDYLDEYLARARYIPYTPDRIDAGAATDLLAILSLKTLHHSPEALLALEKEQFLALLETGGFNDPAYPGGTGNLSTSFICYLLEHSPSREAFLAAYADTSLMEAYYGKDLWGMIRQWLESLA